MNRLSVAAIGLLFICGTVRESRQHNCQAESPLPSRVAPWNDSRVKGSPDPPLPYKATRVFAKVELDRPTDVSWLPSAQKWLATQHFGKLMMFANDPKNATAEPFLDMSDVLGTKVMNAYSILFHPDQANHPWCYITVSAQPQGPRGVRLGRLKVTDPAIPAVDENSWQEILAWSSKGHVGTSMRFGPDGMLYLSIGDGQRPYPPDADNTGQDLSDLQSSILRIDVSESTADRPYKIPPDNPFVEQTDARGEIWAFGFRNPWKIAFDPDSGDLLAADVGWEMREMIHRVTRGRNHGWSIMEGSQTVKTDQKPVVPITPPLFEHTHVDSRSISGGHYWYSDRIPELKGAYIYGDWMTGKVWALKHVGDEVIWQKELVDTPLQVISFMLDETGEVLILAYDGTMLRIDPNTHSADQSEFPRRLSETGLFADVENLTPSPGVIEYEISAHHWADGTHSRQWIAVPTNQQLGLYNKDNWQTGDTAGRFEFPPDTVLAKTVSYLTEKGNVSSERRIETQLLHRYVDDWRAYNYVWNDEQTDAVLQDDIATERKLIITDPDAPGGQRSQTWRHASRSECLLCHIWAAGSAHAFWPEQLNITYKSENQLKKLAKLGLFDQEIPAKDPPPSPYDPTEPLEDRARSYLALNCSTCHRPQGGGTANFNFDWTKSLEENNYLDQPPAQGTFGIDSACVVASGDPLRSVLIYRALKSGRGHMPQFGSNVIDLQGIQVLHDWIESIPSESRSNDMIRTSVAQVFSADPFDKAEPIVLDLLNTTSGAMALSLACGDRSINSEIKSAIVELGTASEAPEIRDLFEHYLPEDQRVKRLGPSVDAQALLAMKGSAERGQELFQNAKDVNCRSCHRIGELGQSVGPDLSMIGTQQRPDEILESILNPSAKIDPKYRARQIVTGDGKALIGIVVKVTDQEITLVDSAGKSTTILADDIEDMRAAPKSAMPDQLLAGMTAQQAADLLAYLAAQRKIGPLQHKHAKIRRAAAPIVIDGKLDESEWKNAPPLGDFEFTWWNEGDQERQQTDARMLWDDDYLYVSFRCQDADIQATRTERDSPVYRDDCVEVFASPELNHPKRYFNLEMNALGAQLDEYRPEGVFEEPIGWNPDGIQIAVVVDGTINNERDTDQGWTLEAAIPFKLFRDVLPDGRPNVGDQWRLNLNRLDANMSVKSQWSQGDRNFARFHHPEYFGFVEFVR